MLVTDEELTTRIEKRLKNHKQWTDEYGIEWIEVNGNKFPKHQLVRQCVELEQAELMEEQFNFLSY